MTPPLHHWQVGNSLTGQLPSLSHLPNLVSFMVGHNRLNGSLPADWANSLNLQVFSVEFNYLSGTLPQPAYRSVRDSGGENPPCQPLMPKYNYCTTQMA